MGRKYWLVNSPSRFRHYKKKYEANPQHKEYGMRQVQINCITRVERIGL